MNPPSQRLFVGLFPSSKLLTSLTAHMRSWQQSLTDPRIKWSPVDNLHLTLCFLGNVEEGRIAELEARLLDVSGPPADLQLRGLGVFPNHQRPRVLWAGVEGQLAALDKLQRSVQDACAPFVEKPESKPFSPHLTLARIKESDGPLGRAIRRLAKEHVAVEFGSWPVDRVQLMASRSNSDRSRYEELLSVPLSSGR